VPTVQLHHPAEYTFFIVLGTHFCLHYCGVLLAVKTSHSPVCQYHSTLSQNEKNVIIQLCQYWYPSSKKGWCIMNWNGRGRKWSQPVRSTTATFAWRNREKPMNICHASWCHGQDSHQALPSQPIPSVVLYNIIHQ